MFEMRLAVLALLTLLGSLPAGDRVFAQGGLSFVDPRTDIAVGSDPYSIALGDFNGDAIPDLAVANNGSNNVSVLLGKGDGSFRVAQTLGVGSHPRSIVVGDFNGDKILDLAIANQGPPYEGSSTISVLLGKGDATFRSAGSVRVHSHPVSYDDRPSSLVVGDFNGDMIQDLAVAIGGSDTISVLVGNGDGTFTATQDFPTGIASLALGDFNSDGIQDLAIATADSDATRISILRGRGDGTFESGQTLRLGNRTVPRRIAAADFNGDKIPDLAVVHALPACCPSPLEVVSILLGKGNGTFEEAKDYRVGNSPSFITVGDVNGDKIADVVVTNSLSQDVSILLGNGDGTLGPAQKLEVGSNPIAAVIGDLNGDGQPDVAVVNADSNHVSIWLNGAPAKSAIPPSVQERK